jgi:hypothetical protein
MKRFVTLSGVILLTACGGGGRNTGPSSMAGATLVSAVPSPGSTISLAKDANGQLHGELLMTFSVVSDKDIPDPFPTVGFDTDRESCAGGVTGTSSNRMAGWGTGTLRANQPRTFTLEQMYWGTASGTCPLPTTTSLVRVSVVQFCVFGCTGNEPFFSTSLPITYTFVAQ